MSATAAWTYTNVCTVYPLDTVDTWSNTTHYGAAYLINATWEAISTERSNENGDESGLQHTIYTECKYNGAAVRVPLKGDYIALGDKSTVTDPIAAGADEVLTVLQSDMSFFGEDPDYEINTFRKWQGS